MRLQAAMAFSLFGTPYIPKRQGKAAPQPFRSGAWMSRLSRTYVGRSFGASISLSEREN